MIELLSSAKCVPIPSLKRLNWKLSIELLDVVFKGSIELNIIVLVAVDWLCVDETNVVSMESIKTESQQSW